MSSTWTIVQFYEEDNCPIEAVPTQWIKNNTCSWPPTNVSKAIKNQDPAEHNWDLFKIRVIGKPYSNYLTARTYLNVAQETSDLSECENSKRKRFPSKRLSSSDDTEDSELLDSDSVIPPFPSIKSFVPERKAALEYSHSQESQDTGSNNIKIISSKKKQSQALDMAANFQTYKKNLSSRQQTQRATQIQDDWIQIEEIPIVLDALNEVIPPPEKPVERQSTSNSSRTTTEFERQIVRQLNMLQVKMDQQTEMITMLMESVKRNNILEKNETNAVNFLLENNFPLSNQQDLELLEEKLMEKGNQNALEIDLKKIGGNNAKHFFKRIMERLMIYSFARNYSWDGLKGKEAFRSLNLAKVIKVAIVNGYGISENEVEKLIKEYLRRAKERSEAKKRVDK